MLKNIKRMIISLLIVTSFGSFCFAVVTPQPALAKTEAECTKSFLGFPAWYRGQLDENCDIKSPTDAETLKSFIFGIALNIVEICLRVVGFIAVFFIIYGGFMYIISQGNAQNTAKALSTILNAIIGLVISIASVAIVNFIANGIWK